MQAATGLAIGRRVDPQLAATAVKQAMQQLDITTASSVLLFLTSEFANDPLPAIRAAAKAASCTQVIGCSAPGIFTEQDWVLDAPAAAVMVFGNGVSIHHVSERPEQEIVLALAAPNAINSNRIIASGIRFGGVSGDATGQGPFSVWQNAKGIVSGYCEAAFSGLNAAVSAAHDVKLLGKPQLITRVDGHDVQSLGDTTALQSLHAACRGHESLPLHLLMAVFADYPEVITRGDYQLATLISVNDEEGSVTIAKPLQEGQYLSWAIRDTQAAQDNLENVVNKLVADLETMPDFGLMFSCLGRGPYFYDGVDRDLMLLKEKFPDMPFIGFYGNGEIAPINGVNELLQYSAVLGLFARSEI